MARSVKYPVWFLIVLNGKPQTMLDEWGKRRPMTVAAYNDSEFDLAYANGWIPTEPGTTHLDSMDEIRALAQEYERTRK